MLNLTLPRLFPAEVLADEHLLVGGLAAAHTVVAVDRPVLHLGRGITSDVVLDDHTVSRRHALLVRTGEGTRLIDDRSLNGVYVNGERVHDVTLADGDVVRLGRVTLTYCRPA